VGLLHHGPRMRTPRKQSGRAAVKVLFSGPAELPVGGHRSVKREALAAEYECVFIPLTPKRLAELFDIERPAAAVFVVNPTVELCARIQSFAARFGLTAEEGLKGNHRRQRAYRRRSAAKNYLNHDSHAYLSHI
jgi:hypothetical protein